MNLFEINAQIEDIIRNGVDEEGTLSNAAFEALNELQMAKDQKQENIGLYIKNLAYEVASLKQEQKNITERIRVRENKIERLKEYLKATMEAGKKFETPRVVIKWTKGESVKVDEEKLPKKWFRAVLSPDKASIKAALKAGQKVKGAELVKTTGLSVK